LELGNAGGELLVETFVKITDILCMVFAGLRILMGRADALDYWACWIVVGYVVVMYAIKKWGCV